jgi:translation elongation factor EF-4
LTHHERLSSDQREGLLEKRLKKMENRLAALQARTAIDIGMVYHLIWRNMDKATRDDALAWAYNSTIARLKRKLPGKDAEIKEMVMNDPLNRQA